MAIGAYDVDIHPIQNCKYPDYMLSYYPILPFFIPLRAMTNAKFENLVVTGKTMAQSFLGKIKNTYSLKFTQFLFF